MRTHHEHLRSGGSRLGLVHHLGLMRQKWLFEDNRGPVEQVTNFGSSGIILSVVIFLANEVGIPRILLQGFANRGFGRTLFWAIGFSFAFAFLLSFRGFFRYGGMDSVDLWGFTRCRWILGWTIRNNIWDWLHFGGSFSRGLGYWTNNSIDRRNN